MKNAPDSPRPRRRLSDFRLWTLDTGFLAWYAPKQTPNPGECLRWKTHCQLQPVIPFKYIWLFFAPSESLPIYKTAQPREMAIDRNWKITPMNQPLNNRFTNAFGHMAATDGDSKGAIIAIEIGEALKHAGKDMEIFRVRHPAFSAAMSGNDAQAALEWKGQTSWVAVFAA